MKRVAKWIPCLESYRNDQELFNLECCTYMSVFYAPDEWKWIYDNFDMMVIMSLYILSR